MRVTIDHVIRIKDRQFTQIFWIVEIPSPADQPIALVMQQLTPEVIGRIATALGLDRKNVQTAIGASVPALLAGLSKVASQPGGAQKLADAAGQHVGVLDNLTGTIGGANQTALVDKGSRMLSSLISGQDQTALNAAIGKFAGVGDKRQQRTAWLVCADRHGYHCQATGDWRIDPKNLASLFASQKDHIRPRCPPVY